MEYDAALTRLMRVFVKKNCKVFFYVEKKNFPFLLLFCFDDKNTTYKSLHPLNSYPVL